MLQKRPGSYYVVKPGDPHPMGWKVPPVNDLRSAIELLKTLPGQYIETDREVDPRDELAGVYRYVGAGVR